VERTHSGADQNCENKGEADRKLLCTEGNIPPLPIPPSAAWGSAELLVTLRFYI